MGRLARWLKSSKAWFRGLLQAGPEDEKIVLLQKIGKKFSIPDLRRLASETVHVHKSPGKRGPRVIKIDLVTGKSQKFPYEAPSVSRQEGQQPDYGV